MRRIFPILILVLLAPLAFAQTVAVTATITGSNTAPYIYGTYQIQLVDASGTQIPSTGLPTSYSGSLTSVGALSVAINPNSNFVSGSQWKFTVCSASPKTPNVVVYGAQVCFSQSTTITGAGDISAALSASAPALYYFNPVTGAFYSTSGGYVLPIAQPTTLGGIKPDNTTI